VKIAVSVVADIREQTAGETNTNAFLTTETQRKKRKKRFDINIILAQKFFSDGSNFPTFEGFES